jgi:hypothetical protein
MGAVMFWDDLVRRWRRDNRQLGPHLLAGAAGYVAVSPTRRRRSRVLLALLIIAVGFIVALAVATGQVRAATPWSDGSDGATNRMSVEHPAAPSRVTRMRPIAAILMCAVLGSCAAPPNGR